MRGPKHSFASSTIEIWKHITCPVSYVESPHCRGGDLFRLRFVTSTSFIFIFTLSYVAYTAIYRHNLFNIEEISLTVFLVTCQVVCCYSSYLKPLLLLHLITATFQRNQRSLFAPNPFFTNAPNLHLFFCLFNIVLFKNLLSNFAGAPLPSHRPSPPAIPPSLSLSPPLPSSLHPSFSETDNKASFSMADPQFTLTSTPSQIADRGWVTAPEPTWCTTVLDPEPDSGPAGPSAPVATWLSLAQWLWGHRQKRTQRSHRGLIKGNSFGFRRS